LGEALAAAGWPLHLPLIEAGALLHDLGKTPCLGTSRSHAEWGAALLEELGYPEVAQVVRQHVYLQPWENISHHPGEVEVVNYADKRVMHDRVVTLETRFADLQERYGRTPEARSRIATLQARTRVLEERLFAGLPLTPHDLLQLNHGRDE
jgi:putative nucleotidyltransferase with HDIG domain